MNEHPATMDPATTSRPSAMKPALIRCTVAALALAAASARAGTINWGSEFLSTLLASDGTAIPATGYTFELGTFATGFTPTSSNILDWESNWTSVDTADYNAEAGYFTAALEWTPAHAEFVNRQAYLWIHNAFTDPANEWLLVTDAAWKFPAVDDGCCGTTFPVQWSVSDVDTEATPLWGANTATSGGGAATADAQAPTLQAAVSIFAWTIDDETAGYNTLANQDLAGSGAVFKVVLPEGDSFTETFWDTNQTWTDVFKVANGADLASIFSGGYTGSGGITRAGLVEGQGYFTLNGSTLSWTAIPEPAGVIVGLLLAAGLLRRRRA